MWWLEPFPVSCLDMKPGSPVQSCGSPSEAPPLPQPPRVSSEDHDVADVYRGMDISRTLVRWAEDPSRPLLAVAKLRGGGLRR